MKRFKHWMGSWWMRFILSAAVLVFIFSRVDLVQLRRILAAADYGLLAAAFFVFSAIYAVLILRWWLFIQGVALKGVNVMTMVRYFFIGVFGNLFMPTSIGGDMIKVVGLCRGRPNKQKVVASVLLDRLSGFFGIVTVAALAYPLAGGMFEGAAVGPSLAMLAFGSAAVTVVLFHEGLYSQALRVVGRFESVKRWLIQLHYDIALLKGRKRVLAAGWCLSCAAQVLLAVSFWLSALALGQTVALKAFVLAVPLICVVTIVPSIGGLGVREAGSVFFLTKAGMAAEAAVGISLINFAFMTVIGAFGAVMFFLTAPVKDAVHDLEEAVDEAFVPPAG